MKNARFKINVEIFSSKRIVYSRECEIEFFLINVRYHLNVDIKRLKHDSKNDWMNVFENKLKIFKI